MKTLLATTLIFLCSNTMFGQEKSTVENVERNTIYAEAFGQGLCWSLNYDRLFNTQKRVMNSFTVGLVYVPKSMDFGDGIYYGIPISYNWLFGKKSHHLELGIGLTNLLVNPRSKYASNFYSYLSPKIGYRYQRPNGGLFFRATAVPMIDILNVTTYNFGNGKSKHFSTLNNVAGLGYAVFPWPGLSIGYTFK